MRKLDPTHRALLKLKARDLDKEKGSKCLLLGLRFSSLYLYHLAQYFILSDLNSA
jgi:hypothetical protein